MIRGATADKKRERDGIGLGRFGCREELVRVVARRMCDVVLVILHIRLKSFGIALWLL